MNQRVKLFWMLALVILLGCVQVLPITGALAAGGSIYHVKVQGGDDGNSGLSWSDAFATLQKALETAMSGDQIRIAAGTYYPTKATDSADPRTKTFQMKNGVAIYGGYAADGSTERDWVNNKTILSGDLGILGDTSDNAYHVFFHYQLNFDQTALLDGVIITGGNANWRDHQNHQYGGGMYNWISHPTLQNVTISGNTAMVGGGMGNQYSNPILKNVTFRDNTATESAGGINNNTSSPILTDVMILNNTAAVDAGGIKNDGGAPVLTNVEISGNTAIAGEAGGMYNYASSPVLNHVTISRNMAIRGGGLTNSQIKWPWPVLNHVTISENEAQSEGGGIYNHTNHPILNHVTIRANKAGSTGGGIHNFNSSSVLTNVLITSNQATNGGGGMYSADGSWPILTNVTISGNASTSGYSGLGHSTDQSRTPTMLNNSIIWGNSRNNVDTKYLYIEHSLVNIDPKFIDAEQGNYRLQFDSPAIDTGSSQYYDAGRAPDLSGITTDLDGNPRLFGNQMDMGAYEYQDQAGLTSLAVTGNQTFLAIEPAFSSSVINYQAILSSSITNLMFTPTLREPTAQGKWRINEGAWSPVVNGSAHEVPNNSGELKLEIQVEADYGNTKTYTVKLLRIPSPNFVLSHSDWTNQDVTVTLAGQSGMMLEYSLDGQQWSAYTDPFQIQNEGQTKLYARQTDALKNVSETAEAEVRIDKTAPVITLKGNPVISIHRGDPFVDPGADVTDNRATNLQAVVSGTVDTSKLGDYTLTYGATDLAGNQAVPVTRTVKVVREGDLVEPTITLDPSGWTTSDVVVTLSGEADARMEYSLDGQRWSVYTGPFQIQDENQTKVYARQTDALQNVSETAEAEVRIDKTAPVITLKGNPVMSIHRGDSFTDPGADVTDNRATNLQAVVSGAVDTSKLGDYTLTYGATDLAGNQAVPVIRTVKVVREGDLVEPTITLDPSGWTASDVEVTLSGEQDAILEYSLDGQQWEAYAGPFKIQDENQTKIYARQTDSLQQISETTEAEIRIDRIAPVITLNGAATMNHYQGSIFRDPGVTITDNLATGLTTVVSGTVDTTRLGTYTLQYEAADWAGNQAASVTRTVRVFSRPITPTPVTGVTLTPQTLTLTIGGGGESGSLHATITPSNATNQAVSWSSSNPSVAVVDANGRVTAKRAGQTTITVRTADGSKTASSEVTVVDKEEEDKLRLEVSPSTLTLKTAEAKSFKVYAVQGKERKEITTDKDTTYEIDHDVITVNRGRITAGKKAGEAQITIRYAGAEAVITVKVEKEKEEGLVLKASESLFLIQPDRTASFRVYALEKGRRKDITKDNNTTYSIDEDLAKVTAGRVKTGKEDGETELVIRYEGEELTIPVIISKVSVKSLTASKTKVLLELDTEETVNIRATLSNKREQDVTELVHWTSSTPNIVEVTVDGTIIPLKEGTAVLTAKYGSKTVKVSVVVLEEKKPQQLRANRTSLTLRAEHTASLIITAHYEGGYKEEVTEAVKWTTENPEIAQVEDGVVKGVSAGTTTIKAVYAGKEVKIRITVRK